MTYTREQDLVYALKNNSFVDSFTHLKLNRGCKEDWRKQGREWVIGELRLWALQRAKTCLRGITSAISKLC